MLVDMPKSLVSPRALPPVGAHAAVVTRARTVETDDAVVVTWEFKSKGSKWELDQELRGDDLIRALMAMGFAGARVDVSAVLVGRQARIEVRRYGKRKLVRVSDVLPLLDT